MEGIDHHRPVTGSGRADRALKGEADVFCDGDAPAAIENEALLPAFVSERGARSETDLTSEFPKGSFDPERRSSVAVVGAKDVGALVLYESVSVIDVCYQNSVCSPVSDFSIDIADDDYDDDNCIGNNNNSNGRCDVVVVGSSNKSNSNLPPPQRDTETLYKSKKYWSFLRLHVIK